MNALEVVNKNLEEKIKQITEFVADGKAIDYENYAALVGEIKGLKYAVNEIREMNNTILRQDDNDD